MSKRKRQQNAWSVDSVKPRQIKSRPRNIFRFKRIVGNSLFLVALTIVGGYLIFVVRESYYAKKCDTKICEIVKSVRQKYGPSNNNKVPDSQPGVLAPLSNCAELGGKVCLEADLCNGESVEAWDGTCCLGECKLVRPGTIKGELGIAGIVAPSRELFQFLSGEEFDEYLNRSLALIKESGASYYRLSASEVGGFDFTLAESENGVYDFSLQDKIVQKFNQNKIPLVVMISPWPRPSVVNSNNRQVLNYDIDDYQNYVQQLVERYDGDEVEDMPGLTQAINYFEVATDPDAYNQFTLGALSPGKYFTTLQATSEAIKEANSDAQIIFGSVSFSISDSAESREEKIDYLSQVLNFNAVEMFDAWKVSYLGNSADDLNSILQSLVELERKPIYVDHLWWDDSIEGESEQEIDQADAFLEIYKVAKSYGAKLAYYGVQDTPPDILPPFRVRGLYRCQEFAKTSQNISYCTSALVKKLGTTYLELANR